jgi:hypothetical protein
MVVRPVRSGSEWSRSWPTPFHPADDLITSLGLHHHTATDFGHDVLIEAYWHAWPAA